MNTMKKWLVAGLVGLSMAGSSQGSMMLDDFDWTDSIWASGAERTTSVQSGDARLTGQATLGTATQPQVGISVSPANGGQALFHYERLSSTANATAKSLARIEYGEAYNDWTGGLAGYTGITLNFGAVMPDFLGARWTSHSLSQEFGFFIQVEANFTQYFVDAATFSGYQPSATSGGNPSWNVGQDYTWNFADQIWKDSAGDSFAIDPSTITTIYIRFDTGNKLTTIATSADDSNGILLNYIQLAGDGPTGVPEPETVWMIVAVLASLAVTFRRQLMDFAGRFVKT